MKKACRFFILAAVLMLVVNVAAYVSAEEKTPSGGGASTAGENGHETGSTVIVKVNGRNVTATDLVRQMRQIAMQSYQHGDLTPEITAQIRKKAIERAIVEELAYQRAVSLGITIPSEAVDRQIAQLKKSLGSEARYRNYLSKQGENEQEFRGQVKRYFMVKKAIAMEVDENIRIGPGDVDKAYEELKDQYIQPERVQVTDVVFFLDADAPESRQKANLIREQILTKFDSDPTGISSDGTFIVRRQVNLNKNKESELYEAARKLAPGGISTVVNADKTLHILKLTG